jgi:hypothetical protein
VSELTLETDRAAIALAKAEARRDDLEARLAATRTRTALEAHARRVGMKPAEPGQVIVVPDAYLAGGSPVEEGGHALAALGRRVAETLVPSARAKTRTASLN